MATLRSAAATANVMRMPCATASASAVVIRYPRYEREHGPMSDAPVIRPFPRQIEHESHGKARSEITRSSDARREPSVLPYT